MKYLYNIAGSMLVNSMWGQTYYPMSSGNFSETFKSGKTSILKFLSVFALVMLLGVSGLMCAYQAKASQINTGATLAYYLRKEDDNNIILYGGLWSRWNGIQTQALIPKIGFEIKKIRITAAYDMVTNNLASEVNAANSARPNTFEISLNYIFKNTERSMDYDCFLFNPRY